MDERPNQSLMAVGIRTMMNGKSSDEVRMDLIHLFGAENVWSEEEMQQGFEYLGFAPPFIGVRRKSDDRQGRLAYTQIPRFYYDFVPG